MAIWTLSARMGSSPQVRGAPPSRPRSARACGIIPAGAGSTPSPRPVRIVSRDHPRRCGEHDGALVRGYEMIGSSPQVRGAPRRPGTAAISRRDHPRRCGEHVEPDGSYRPLSGSSPQVRGALCHAVRERPPPRDHPRRCGEHSFTAPIDASYLGSSPQVRGARWRPRARRASPGIIPAGAGSTRVRTGPVTLEEDHPRRCGEHQASAVSSQVAAGSSPQVRGALSPVAASYSS